MQDATGYPPLQARTRLAKQAIRAEKVGAVVMLAAPIVMALAKAPHLLVIEVFVGVMIFALSILLHAVTLPVEFDASFRRALPVLKAGRYLDDKDMPAAREILRAAAFTYVAAAAMRPARRGALDPLRLAHRISQSCVHAELRYEGRGSAKSSGATCPSP